MRVYDLKDYSQRAAIKKALRRKPKSLWFQTEQGPVRAINPRARIVGGVLLGVDCEVEVAPRYCATVSNY